MREQRPPLAKLTRPRLHAAFKRTRLFKRLDQRKRRPVVWVSGPPGSGKTTLVASYLETRKAKVFWYRVDEGDRDAATFFAYLRELPRVSRTKKSALPYLTADYLPDLAAFSRRFFRELFKRLGKDAVLALDNWHAAATEQMDTIVREAADELPGGTSLFVVSRSRPPPSLARQTVHGELLEIGSEELRLSFEEAEAIVKLQGAQHTTNVSEVHQRVDGWVAGLVAIANARPRSMPARAEAASQAELLFDYFASEVLEQATPAQQWVLLQTALFQQFTVPMAAALTGESTVEALLDGLYRRQCFVERSAGTGAYQYHDLFREFLLSRLAKLDAAQIRDAKVRAAEVLEQQGSGAAAIQLYLDAGIAQSAARLIRALAPSMIEQGRFTQLGQWLTRLPQAELEADAWLRYWLGSAQLLSDPAAALTSFRSAHAAFRRERQTDGEFYAIEGAIFALRESWASYETLDEWIEALAEVLPALAPSVDLAVQARGWNVFTMAAFDRQLGHPLLSKAVDWLRARLFDGSLSDSQKLDAASALIGLANMSANRKHVDAAIAIAEPIARRETTAPLQRLIWAFDYGSYLGHGTELARSIEVLTDGIDLGNRLGSVGLSYYAYTMRGFAHWWRNEPTFAEADFERMSSIAFSAGIPKTVFEYKGRALLASQYGHIEKAMKLAELCVADADARGPAYMRTYARADMAPIAIQAGRLDQAEKWIDEGEAIDRPTIVRANEAQYCAVRASLAFARGDRETALTYLRESLRIAHKPGVRGELCASRPQLPMLFGEALNEGIEVDLVRELIKVWRIPPPDLHVERWPWPIKIRTLGTFDVLIDDVSRLPPRRAQVKVLELLKALVAAGPLPVSNESLVDWLWPDSDGDAAAINLRTNVLRLRKLLGHDAAVVVQDNKVALNADVCWVDAWAFERLSSAELSPANSHSNLSTALRLYSGHLLPQESGAWLSPRREKLRTRFINCVETLGQALEASYSPDEAARVYRSALEIEPGAERIQRRLRDSPLSAAAPTSAPSLAHYKAPATKHESSPRKRARP